MIKSRQLNSSRSPNRKKKKQKKKNKKVPERERENGEIASASGWQLVKKAKLATRLYSLSLSLFLPVSFGCCVYN